MRRCAAATHCLSLTLAGSRPAASDAAARCGVCVLAACLGCDTLRLQLLPPFPLLLQPPHPAAGHLHHGCRL